MKATKKRKLKQVTQVAPKLAAPTAKRAIAIVNRWLKTEVTELLSVSQATFDPISYSVGTYRFNSQTPLVRRNTKLAMFFCERTLAILPDARNRRNYPNVR